MAETRSAHRCSILIVDDDADVREVLRVALETEGYRVAGVAHGRDALDHLRSHAETCIILLDLLLPVMDGRQFRNAQLRDRSLAWIPMVLMSGAPDPERSARELGARCLVRKALDLDEVKQALRSVGCSQSHVERANPADLTENRRCRRRHRKQAEIAPLVFTPALTIAASPTCCCQEHVCCDCCDNDCTDCCCK